MKDLARKLRKNQTETEARLWAQLRDRRLKGFKFRRQHPIGRYIVDFYCPEKRLVIELDGGGHAEDEQKQSDKKRDEWLKQKGISVFRFWNNIVWDNLEGVLKTILKALDGETPHP
ncbi:MAG TPA: endonuclease domain-containing protein [Proteobacteria bacterium]|nr:endonuclease domain-containing protein [Pseudomonadota bacterium]